MTDALKHPKSNLTAARQSLERMKNAETFESYEIEWREFLGHLEKVWNKVERACQPMQAKFQPWQGRYHSLRKKDMLLRYLKAARDVDSHSIQDLAKMEVGRREMNFVNPRGGYIEHMEIRGGEIVTYRGDPMLVKDTPPHPIALPVKNNGSWYNPPTSHLGQPIADQHPSRLAQLGLEFYEKFVLEAEAKFFRG